VTRILRSLMALVAVTAFIAATTVQAMPAPPEPAAAAMPTAAMGDCPMHASAQSKPAAKHCDGLSLDCVKQLGCIGIASLPVFPTAASWSPFAWTTVAWTDSASALRGTAPEPSQPPPLA
jgi:hypothetical protein